MSTAVLKAYWSQMLVADLQRVLYAKLAKACKKGASGYTLWASASMLLQMFVPACKAVNRKSAAGSTQRRNRLRHAQCIMKGHDFGQFPARSKGVRTLVLTVWEMHPCQIHHIWPILILSSQIWRLASTPYLGRVDEFRPIRPRCGAQVA